jgi:ABC-type multidrug transport system permease subunit
VEFAPPFADSRRMLPFVLIVAGFVLGFATGRWWALVGALALGLWVGMTEEVEVPGLIIGLYIGLPAGLGIASGVVSRRLLARRRRAARV